MNPTIKDVARRANVSVATVSRALNGHENVAEAVRQRVHSAARELHYAPHHAARSLSSRRTETVGVVLPDLHGEFFSELMRGIDQVAREAGMHLLVSSYHGHPGEQAAALRAMRGRVDGLLLMSPYADGADHPIESVAPAMPAVLLNTRLPGGGATALCVDNHGGAMRMLSHLVERGYRRVAFIAGPDDNHDARERLRGYRDALAQALPGVAPWVLPGDFDEASGYRAGRELLASPQPPDAVFAANDMMALGCLFAFGQAGVRVPADIALAGFDDIPLARCVNPALTTMRVDIAEFGARAMRLLLQRIAAPGEPPPAPAAIEPELVQRASTSPPVDSS
jgi:LacI family transcriptional regulator